jgi:hypothetical protein
MHRVATSRDARQFGTISRPASTNSPTTDQYSIGYHLFTVGTLLDDTLSVVLHAVGTLAKFS